MECVATRVTDSGDTGRLRWRVGLLLWSSALLWLVLMVADTCYPLPDTQRTSSVIILAEDKTPLRAFADEQGVWRYPAHLDEVSPLYIEALLAYEDRWFYQHPGVNPFALGRAAWQWLKHGRVISGGSTLTMQVARLIDPHEKSVMGKARQILRALQLEWHYSKQAILSMYLNLAPFGGPIEGVQTASYAYLHKPAVQLSHAEAALLAVLPQAPSRLRPDRHHERAKQYRDKVLRRLLAQGVWSKQDVSEALAEPVYATRFRQPFTAPLLAERMKTVARSAGIARLQTGVDLNMQLSVHHTLRRHMTGLPAHGSAAVLVMENATGMVRAYAGSVDYYDAARDGNVDVVQAVRSPGSLLKPFLYGMAIDEGFIHSASLLSDAPLQVDDYAPRNFMRRYQGAVTVSEALQLSLNVPAVDLLQRVSPEAFMAGLHHAGVLLRLPRSAQPNLSIILGGVGTRLEDLVRGFSAFARQGQTIRPRFRTEDAIEQRYLLSEGAAWMTQAILRSIPEPGQVDNPLGIAWKTGTSFGFRDAWAVGVNQHYTVGVWTGRPDGTPVPGRYGAKVAGPILFDVFRSLPKNKSIARPTSVQQQTICWPLGERLSETDAEHCHQQHSAWVLDETVPPTLEHLQTPSWSAGLHAYWVETDSGLRVNAFCQTERGQYQQRQQAVWPVALTPWLSGHLQEKSRLPAWHPDCTNQAAFASSVSIKRWLGEESQLQIPVGSQQLSLKVAAEGGVGRYLWFLNDQVVGQSTAETQLTVSMTETGEYRLMVLDESGSSDSHRIRIIR